MREGQADTSAERRRAMLRSAMGPAIADALADPLVVEIMVNPDGRLWLDRLGEDASIPASCARRPRPNGSSGWSPAMPGARRMPTRRSSRRNCRRTGRAGERFEGLLPPVTRAPCFAIRKPASRIHRLADYVHDGIMDEAMAHTLAEAVGGRSNILVVGGTSSGKTTLANALLAEMAHLEERVILIEDTRELQCAAPDTVALASRDGGGGVTMADLVRSTLRLRPDRIVVGEIRGAEALDMLKAWNTGHPGGIATVHANSAASALHRIEQLVQESVTTVPRALIAEAIDLIIFIAGRGHARRVETVLRVNGLRPDGAYDLAALARDTPPEPSPHIDGDLS
jgi:type IV secretion system protein VirB11